MTLVRTQNTINVAAAMVSAHRTMRTEEVLERYLPMVEAGQAPALVAELLEDVAFRLEKYSRRVTIAAATTDENVRKGEICNYAAVLVAEATLITVAEMAAANGRSTYSDAYVARVAAITIARDLGATIPALADYWGRDTSTIQHSYKRVANRPDVIKIINLSSRGAA